MVRNARDSKKETEYFDKPQGKILFELDDTNVIVANLSTFNDVKYLEIRKWYKTKDDGWTRTRNGISLPANKTIKLHKRLGAYIESRRS